MIVPTRSGAPWGASPGGSGGRGEEVLAPAMGGGLQRRDPGVGGVTARKGDELSWFDQVEEETRDEQSGRIREILLSRRRNFSRARRHLLDPETTAFVMVLIPEKLPILETDKALAILSAEHRVPVAGLVVNRVLPEVPLGEFLESRRHQEHEYLARIDPAFPRFPSGKGPSPSPGRAGDREPPQGRHAPAARRGPLVDRDSADQSLRPGRPITNGGRGAASGAPAPTHFPPPCGTQTCELVTARPRITPGPWQARRVHS